MIDRYVRSLKEREDNPEKFQDLGTLLSWILEEHGFLVLEKPYKHISDSLAVSKGRLQHGVDVLAVRSEEDGSEVSYRFVLKRGAFGKGQFTPDKEGSMLHDIELAASLPTTGREALHGLEPASVKVVAVHNGSVDREQIGPNLQTFLENVERRYPGRKIEWWDAERIVDLICTASPSGVGEPLEVQPSTSLFPPSIRPFFSLALHSLLPERGKSGGGFDYSAMDLVVDERLPLSSDEHLKISLGELHRSTAELALFVQMIHAECIRVSDGSTLPTMDSIEKVSCRIAEHVRRAPKGSPAEVLVSLQALVELYVDCARSLRLRLEPLTSEESGLALPGPGEVVNYPLRTLRLLGYLATAGLALALRAESSKSTDWARAKEFADTIFKIWRMNRGAAQSPITDDQIIELGLVWELWLRLGMYAEVGETAAAVLQWMAIRRVQGFRLPSLWHRARVPFRDIDMMAIVEAHFGRSEDVSSSFEDGASTILPLALYLASGYHENWTAEPLGAFSSTEEGRSGARPALFAEVWCPPADAALKWYVSGLEREGICRCIEIDDVDAFRSEFEAIASPIGESVAKELNIPVVDRFAWKLHRMPPPMSLFVDFCREGQP